MIEKLLKKGEKFFELTEESLGIKKEKRHFFVK